jgi:beta-lactamase superfamily II metal-dependent hydrolase
MAVRLQIFDVEHGACALATANNGTRLMIDCGHNATTGWRPGSHLIRQGASYLEMLAITNYDEDHASGAPDLFDRVNVGWLLRNKSVSGETIKSLKSEDGMGPGIDRLVREISRYTLSAGTAGASPEPVFDGMERSVFSVDYPTFDDENNLSMVLFLKCYGVGIMFPGDLEKPGFAELLKREAFRQALRETNVYVAPHHGRESGCCEEKVQFLKNVFYVAISDQGYQYETQETLPFYRRIARGAGFRGENRQILTTRNDGAITFEFNPGSWTAA